MSILYPEIEPYYANMLAVCLGRYPGDHGARASGRWQPPGIRLGARPGLAGQ
jgi:hypothetical protein